MTKLHDILPTERSNSVWVREGKAVNLVDLGFRQPLDLEQTQWFCSYMCGHEEPTSVAMVEVSILDLIPTQDILVVSKLEGQRARGLDTLGPIEVFAIDGMLLVRTHHRFANAVIDAAEAGRTTLTVKLFAF